MDARTRALLLVTNEWMFRSDESENRAKTRSRDIALKSKRKEWTASIARDFNGVSVELSRAVIVLFPC